MQLNDSLRICLLALASRYPDHIVDMNEDVLGTQSFGAEGWLVLDVIDLLEQTTPELLQVMARIVVNPQKCEIYLLDHSEQVPAVVIHCRGKIPSGRGSMTLRQATQKLLSSVS